MAPFAIHLQCRVALWPYADVDIGVFVVYDVVDINWRVCS